MATEAGKGQEAMKVSDYQTAIKHLTAALKTSQSPLWLIQRATCYQRTGQHDLSLIDADNALLASIGRGKRDLIATSHFRRAVALHGLGRFGDSRLCLTWCNKRNDKEKGLTIWMAKVKADFEKAGGDDAECNKITVKEVPDKPEEVTSDAAPKEEKKAPVASKTPAVTVVPAAPAPTPKEKIRTEWYQSTNTVTIEVFAKGVPKENAEVKIEEGSVRIQLSFKDVMLIYPSLMSASQLPPQTALMTTHSLLSSPRSTLPRAPSVSHPTRSKLSSTNPSPASNGHLSKVPSPSHQARPKSQQARSPRQS